MYCLIDLILGLRFEALVDFFATFAEWFSCAVVSPAILYWGMMKTENVVDQHIIDTRNATTLVVVMTTVCLVLGTWLSFFLPPKFEALPFVMFMLSFSVFLMATRKDPLKILVGLNMAENALYPFIAESPLGVIPFMLVLMIFVNVVGIFVITQAYREYRTLSITKWRGTG
jgi:hydrogenase-4 membrane subunit HyfE